VGFVQVVVREERKPTKKTKKKRRSSGLIDEAVMNGVERQFEAIRDAELIENIVQVIFYGLLRNEKFFADFFVAESLGHQLHNFFLAIR
jgi:hypothetical protein